MIKCKFVHNFQKKMERKREASVEYFKKKAKTQGVFIYNSFSIFLSLKLNKYPCDQTSKEEI